MKKVIVPIDFSEVSLEGLNYALQLAKGLKSDVHLVHIYAGAFSPDQPIIIQPQLELQKAIEEQLAEVKAKLSKGLTKEIAVSTEAILGFPEVELVRLSKAADTRLIVMSTSGSHGMSGKIFGTISSEVARKAECPVFLIPKGVSFKPIRHILYASNFDSVNPKNIQRLIDIAGLFQANVHFVHIRTEGDSKFKDIEANIFELIFKSGDPDFAFEMSEVSSESIVDGISDYAQKNNIDLIAMVSPKRSFLESIFHRSKTVEMAFNTTLPMLVFH